jgi:two-component system nitrate/nitrite response regulator NarL
VTRVLILAEVGVHREALARSLGGNEHCDVVGVAAGPEEAVAAVDEVGAEVVLVDMPAPGGANAVRTLVAAAPEIKAVALGVTEAEGDVIAFAEAGAAGYVPREGSMDDLVAAVESVSRGECLLSPDIAAKLFRRVATLAREPRLEPIEARLTARELAVLRLIEEGLSNKEIANALSIELPTVKNHVHRILRKLGVRRRTEAAARARRLGLLRRGGPEAGPTELNLPRVQDPDPSEEPGRAARRKGPGPARDRI